MSERKVLNKYYPPDYDPSKIPRIKGERSKQFAIRVMAPFNMRCNSCGEYIYKGKKFNSRMENVEGESYLGIPIRRFYIKCTRCVSEITFRTDPENVDYAPEHGATRLFEALRTAEKMAEAEEKRQQEEEADNPMKQLEKRTTASQREIEMLETLEELKELNARHASLDHEKLIDANITDKAAILDAKLLAALEQEEDERTVREAFAQKRALDESDDSEEDETKAEKEEQRLAAINAWKKVKPNTVQGTSVSSEFIAPKPVAKSIQNLGGIVVKRPAAAVTSKPVVGSSPSQPVAQNRGLALQYSSSEDDSD